MLLREPGHVPIYFFPEKDMHAAFLQSGDHTSRSDFTGDGKFWHITVAGNVAENAAFAFSNPPVGGPNLEGYIAFDWNKMEAWYEEEEEIFRHARDPYKRVDTLRGSRHIKVVIDGITIAETRQPRLLFETGLPTRYYIPQSDVQMDLLEQSNVITQCPYKGKAQIFNIRIGKQLHEGIAWIYRDSTPEGAKVQGLVSFFNEKVDITEDGELLARPKTKWS